MATVTSSTFNDDFKAYMTYSTSSTSTSYKVCVSAAGVYIGCSWANYPWKTTLTATDKSSISDTRGKTSLGKGYHEVVDGSFSWVKKTSSYNVTVKVTTKKNISGGGSGSKSVSFTVPALSLYTVSFNANGGSGAPSSQKKYYGNTLKLSSTKPTRTGYTFLGWSTSSTATSATWTAGDNYTKNASDTLYAVWRANTYSVSFNANGGTNGSVTSLSKIYNKALTLPSAAQSPRRTNYAFQGWSTSSNAASATWSAGGSYTSNITANTTLYAVWKAAYIKPTITKLTAKRVNSLTGADDDEGTNGVVTFIWSNGILSGSAVTPTSIIVQCSVKGANSWSTVYTATSFTDKKITTPKFGNGTAELNGETQYDIKVTITDSYGTVTEATYISKAQFIIDVDADGNGIAFGAACSRPGLSTSWNIYMDNGKGFYSCGSNGLWYNMLGSNASDTFHFGYGGYNSCFGNTYYNGNAVKIRSRSDVDILSENSGVDIAAATDINLRSIGDVCILPKGGTTTYNLYYTAGKSIDYRIFSAGYVSNSSKSIYFTIFFSRPIVNSPSVTVSSYTNGGFIVRQNGKYLFGSGSGTYKKPSSYAVLTVNNNYIRIRADFSSTTNAVNNDACGLEWYGTITFS